MLQHSKLMDDFIRKEKKRDCELRCNFCFKTHFPQSKFCRWSEENNCKKSSDPPKPKKIDENTMNLVKRKIQNLQEGIENKNDVKIKK